MTTWTLSELDLTNYEPARKALSDEEIDVIGFNLNYPFSIRKIARAIELAHGIVQESNIQANTNATQYSTKDTNENS